MRISDWSSDVCSSDLQGIGRAIALRLAKDGAHIAIVDVNDRKMSAVAEEVKALGRKATTFKADVTKRDDVYAAIDHAEESRPEEHTSELQSIMRTSYAVLCLKTKILNTKTNQLRHNTCDEQT